MKKRGNKKGAIETEMLGWWVIGIAVLIIWVVGVFILKGKGVSAVEYIKSLFRLRR